MTTRKQELSRLVIQFIKFGIVGFFNTLISLSIYYIFVYIDADLYLIGNGAGFVIAVLNAYYWNQKYVFKKKDRVHTTSIIKTFTVYGFTFLVSTVLLFVMVQELDISEKIAPLIILCITIPLNFILNKFWALKEE